MTTRWYTWALGWTSFGIVDTGILATNIQTGCETPATVKLSTASDTAIVDDVGKSASKLQQREKTALQAQLSDMLERWNRDVAEVEVRPEVEPDHVITIPLVQQIQREMATMKTMATVESCENKSATNYSIISNNNWNNTYNKQLTKHDTNDDVKTLHLHFNGRVTYML